MYNKTQKSHKQTERHMKTKTITPTVLILASLISTTSLHAAAVNTWTGGGTGDDWNTTGNWDSNTVPVIGETAFFDTGAGGSTLDVNATTAGKFSVNSILHITGTGGSVNFTRSGTSVNDRKFILNKGFLAEGSVSMSMLGTGRLYTSATGGSTGNTAVWNSSGTLTTDVSDAEGFIFNTANSRFVIQQGLVKAHGEKLFVGTKVNVFVDINGGAFSTTDLYAFGIENGSVAEGININGGSLDQVGDMTWVSHADINLDSGVFNLDGRVTFDDSANFVPGELNFTNGSTGSFVSNHTQVELQALIDNGDITKDAGDGRIFLFTDNGSTRTLSLVPEPSSATLLGLAGVALLLRRRK